MNHFHDKQPVNSNMKGNAEIENWRIDLIPLTSQLVTTCPEMGLEFRLLDGHVSPHRSVEVTL